jgi:hypothetical protein
MKSQMAVQEVTILLPSEIFEQIKRAAANASRSVNDVLVEAVIAAAPTAGPAPSTTRVALAQMAYLNDAALWHAARTTMTPDQRDRLEQLHIQQQRDRLSHAEHEEEQALLDLYRGTVLVRARAAALLKLRGYDVTDLDQFTALE